MHRLVAMPISKNKDPARLMCVLLRVGLKYISIVLLLAGVLLMLLLEESSLHIMESMSGVK